MTNTQRATLVGVFDSRAQADRAVDELKKVGFRNDQIGVVSQNGEHRTAAATTDEGSQWEEGAAIGAVAGAGLGGLVGLGVVAGVIPVIGPIVAGGTLAVILANAAGGAAIAGLVGALVGLGVPEEEAHYYEGEFKAGRTLVTVKPEGRHDEALAILRRHGRCETGTFKAAGCAGTDASCASTGQHFHAAEGNQTVRLHEEQLQAHKQPVTTGEVHVRKEVVTEHKTVDVPVTREEVVIERRPAGGPAATTSIREGQEIRIPVKEEQVHVEKTPVVKEEVSVGKRQVTDTEHVSGTVRKEELRVEKTGNVDVKDCNNPKK